MLKQHSRKLLVFSQLGIPTNGLGDIAFHDIISIPCTQVSCVKMQFLH